MHATKAKKMNPFEARRLKSVVLACALSLLTSSIVAADQPKVKAASGDQGERKEKDRHFHFPNARRTIGRTESKSPELVAHAAPQLAPGTQEDGQATECTM